MSESRFRGRDSFLRLALRGYVWLVMLFIVAPLVVITAMSFTPTEFLQFPPSGLSLRWYDSLFASAQWRSALQNSLVVATVSAVFATTLGGTAAFALDRFDYRFGSALFAMSTLPIMLPPVILGVAFTIFFIAIGLGRGTWALVLAHTVFLTPFPFVLISQGLEDIDQTYEEAAMNLGARPVRTIRSITVPLLWANIVTGALFAFIFSLNEYIIAWLVSGFSFNTIPIKIFTSLRYTYSPVIAAISVLFIALTFVVMSVLDYAVGGIWD
ncbi:ABC transporter permease [Halobellus sp. EA9]|uniref:ABC transporter permease n=1 Tax=Halobellus sp. EA9 TaxID=3421647 RepID=UPI003EC01B5C